MVLGLPAPSLRGPSAPPRCASRAAAPQKLQPSRGDRDSASMLAPTRIPVPSQAPMAPRSHPDPAGISQGSHAAFWGSLLPGKQTLALKGGPECPPLSSQVSLPRDLDLAPRPVRLGRLASRPAAGFPPSCCPGRLRVRLPGTEHPPPHLPLHSLAPTGTHQRCPRLVQRVRLFAGRAAGAPRQPGSPPGAPRRYRVTCFDCLTCNR